MTITDIVSGSIFETLRCLKNHLLLLGHLVLKSTELFIPAYVFSVEGVSVSLSKLGSQDSKALQKMNMRDSFLSPPEDGTELRLLSGHRKVSPLCTGDALWDLD